MRLAFSAILKASILYYKYDTSPNLTSEVGFKAYPGVTIACVLRPEMEIPFALRGSLENNTLDL